MEPGRYRGQRRAHGGGRGDGSVGHGAGAARPGRPAAVGVRRAPVALPGGRAHRRRAGGRRARAGPRAAGGARRLVGPGADRPAGRVASRGRADPGAALRVLGPAELRRLRADAGHRAQPVHDHAGPAGRARRSGRKGRAGLVHHPLGLRAARHRGAGAGRADRRHLGAAHRVRARPGQPGRVRGHRPAAAPHDAPRPGPPTARRPALGGQPAAAAAAHRGRARRRAGGLLRRGRGRGVHGVLRGAVPPGQHRAFP